MAQGLIIFDFNPPNAQNELYLAGRKIIRHFIGGQAILIQAAGLFTGFKNFDRVSLYCQGMGTGQSRRAGADNGDGFAAFVGAGKRMQVVFGHQMVHRVTL